MDRITGGRREVSSWSFPDGAVKLTLATEKIVYSSHGTYADSRARGHIGHVAKVGKSWAEIARGSIRIIGALGRTQSFELQ